MLFLRWLLPVVIFFLHTTHAIPLGNICQWSFGDIRFDGSQAIKHAQTAGFWDLVACLGQIVERYADDLLITTQNTYQDVTGQVDQFKGTIDELVTNTKKLREEMTLSVQEKGITLDAVSEELSRLMEIVFDELKAQFPPPDEAFSHKERVLLVSQVMSKVEIAILGLGEMVGMSEECLREHIGNIRPHVERVVVITGDLVEQHPFLFGTMIFVAATYIVPESWFLRPILRLFGFDHSGPLKGSTAAFVQSYFYGGSVPKASWFAHLQSAAMKGTTRNAGNIVAALSAALLGV